MLLIGGSVLTTIFAPDDFLLSGAFFLKLGTDIFRFKEKIGYF